MKYVYLLWILTTHEITNEEIRVLEDVYSTPVKAYKRLNLLKEANEGQDLSFRLDKKLLTKGRSIMVNQLVREITDTRFFTMAWVRLNKRRAKITPYKLFKEAYHILDYVNQHHVKKGGEIR